MKPKQTNVYLVKLGRSLRYYRKVVTMTADAVLAEAHSIHPVWGNLIKVQPTKLTHVEADKMNADIGITGMNKPITPILIVAPSTKEHTIYSTPDELKALEMQAYRAVLERVSHYFFEQYGTDESKMDDNTKVVRNRVNQVLEQKR